MTIFILIFFIALQLNGLHQPYVQFIYKRLAWCIYWCGLGILSSVGLGTGLHTFILYLVNEILTFFFKQKFINFFLLIFFIFQLDNHKTRKNFGNFGKKGPHIASVTLAAYECNSLDFPEPPYPDEYVFFVCFIDDL